MRFMKQIFIQSYSSSLGEVILGDFNGQLCLADWRHRKNSQRILSRIQQFYGADLVEKRTPIIDEASQQLNAYFEGAKHEFSLPLGLAGTPFQQAVWQALLTIEFGATVTYLELATHIGKPKSVRAVANAVGANAISIVVPCHRVIGSSGQLTGYAGGIELKRALLKREGILV